METIEWLIPNEFRTAIGWMIIHSLWQVALVGFLLWVCRRLFTSRSMIFHYRLGISALFLIVVLAALTFWASFPPPDRIGNQQADSASKSIHNLHPFSDPTLAIPSLPETLLDQLENAIPIVVKAWLFGALLFSVRFASSFADMGRLQSKPKSELDPKWIMLMQKHMQNLGTPSIVQIFKSSHVDLPLTYGIWKPIILIPSSLFLQLSPEQLEAIIVHELAHIKRNDYAMNLIQCGLEVVFFYHPVFWWINLTIRESRENVADDTAIKSGISAKDLAYGLANTLNHSSSTPPDFAVAATGKKTPTLTRIKRIMGYETPYSQPSPLSSVSMLVTFMLGATLFVGASSSPEKVVLHAMESPASLHPPLNPASAPQELRPQLDSIPNPSSSLNVTIDTVVVPGIALEDLEAIEMEVLAAMKPFENFNFNSVDSVPEFDWTTPPVPDVSFLMDIPTPDFEFGPSFELILDPMHFESDSMPFPEPFPFMGFSGQGISKDSLKVLQEQFKVKQKEWQLKFEEQHQAWQQKFQEKMAVWEEQNKPKIEAFQLKMEEWQKANQPKMEEFQRKMEKWQEENEAKMKEKIMEFERKMEDWQQKHQNHLNKNQKNE